MAGATQFCPSDLCQGDEKSADNTSLLARALKMHRCKSVGQNRHVSLPCMPRKRSDYPLSLRQNKKTSLPGQAPGKDTLRAANAATERGLTGENARANAVSRRALSPVLICLFVKIKDPSFPGHAPGKDTLRAADAATKERFTGRKRVKRKRLPVVFPSFHEREVNGEKTE